MRAASCCATRPACSTETVADTVFALLMATSRRVVELSNLVREGRWTQNIGEDLFGWDVHGKTLGLLGFGRIGQAIARRAALGFGMPVLYHTRRPVDLAAQAPELQGRAAHTPLDELLARADIVVAMLPLSDSTRGMIDARVFGAHEAGRDLHQRRRAAPPCRRPRCSPRSTRARCAPPASTCSRPSRCRWIRRCARIRA